MHRLKKGLHITNVFVFHTVYYYHTYGQTYQLLVCVCGRLVAGRVEAPLLMENRLRHAGSRLAHSLPHKSSPLIH